MTTRIHIVNLGHGVVEAKTSEAASPATKLYQGDSINLYVWDGQDVIVREEKPATLQSPKAQSEV